VNTKGPQVIRSYLADLDAALAGVPADVRRDIVAGVAEELSGLDAATAASRIESFGDPAFIAAEASAESRAEPSAESRAEPGAGPGAQSNAELGAQSNVGAGPTETFVVGPRLGASSQRWYVVVTALLIDFGTFVLPFAGWVGGIMMTWSSPLWTQREKRYVTLAPIVAGLVFGVVVSIVHFAATGRIFTPTGLTSWNFVVGFAVVPIPVAIGTGTGIYLSRRGWERTA
jgi:uncharacterized membrane protein